MSSVQFPQPGALTQHTLQQRIVVKHVYRPRTHPQTLLQIRDHSPQTRFSERIEEIEHHRLRGKSKLGRVGADRFQREALLCFASVLAQILLSSLMQRRQELHAHDAPKGIVRSHQTCEAFSRSEIDEDKVAKVKATLLTKGLKHLAEKIWLRRLIRRVEKSEQAVAPTHSRAGRVNAMIPIMFSVAEALPPPFRSGVANKLPQRRQQLLRRRDAAFSPGNVIPPSPRGTRQADPRRRRAKAAIHSRPSSG